MLLKSSDFSLGLKGDFKGDDSDSTRNYFIYIEGKLAIVGVIYERDY